MSYFGIVEFEPGPLLDCLNSIIFFAHPDEKRPAHLTMRGPVMRRPVDKDNAQLIKKAQTDLPGTMLKIFAIGDFFTQGRQTVYFHCGSERIEDFWHKPHFPRPVPHVTLYDGSDEKFARELCHRLRGHRMIFQIAIKDFRMIKTVPGQKQFSLIYDLNPVFMSDILGKEVNIESVRHLSNVRRLDAIDQFCRWLKNWCRSHK